jgi:hypothetical protein
MDGLSVFFIVFFGLAAAIPAIWSIIGLIRGNTRFWPAVLGTIWAIGLLLVTFIGAHTNWGGCSADRSESSKGAIGCFIGDNAAKCEFANQSGEKQEITPDVWKWECKQGSDDCPKNPQPIPPGQFCPTGQKPVFPFCERIQAGGYKQPWAIWSDISFIAAGLWLLWIFHYFERSETTRAAGEIGDNPMLMVGLLSVAYGLIVIFMGPPSQWYHASMKDWGGWFDTMSVVAWMAFNAVYVSYMLLRTMWGNGRRTERTILVLVFWFVLVFICGVIANWPGARTATYFITGVPWLSAEFAYLIWASWHSDEVKYLRNKWLFWANFALLAGTMTLWSFYNPDFPLTSATACQSREWFPGHALFHILASFSTMLTFWSFTSERNVSS